MVVKSYWNFKRNHALRPCLGDLSSQIGASVKVQSCDPGILMISVRSFRWFLLSACVLPLAIGCGRNSPRLVPVTGAVTLDGKPVSGATVVFHPEVAMDSTIAAQVTESQAITEVDGTFTLINIHNGSQGAMTGHHKVTVTKLVMKDGTEIPPNTDLAIVGPNAKQLIPPPYTDAKRTTLSAEVADGGSEIFLDLKTTP